MVYDYYPSHLSSSCSPGSFLEHCEELKSQRDLLGAVQQLLNIPPTPYPELDQTEQDLSYLRALYDNYQRFIHFDKRLEEDWDL